jgi:hypothetical protein
VGTETNPGYSCAHILLNEPDSDDGLFWILPESGTTTNTKFKAYCDFSSGRTMGEWVWMFFFGCMSVDVLTCPALPPSLLFLSRMLSPANGIAFTQVTWNDIDAEGYNMKYAAVWSNEAGGNVEENTGTYKIRAQSLIEHAGYIRYSMGTNSQAFKCVE